RNIAGLDGGEPLVRVSPEEITGAGIKRVPRMAGVEGGKPTLEDGRILDVGSVLWCTGFKETYPWIKLGILDEAGRVKHERGVATSEPGLYFVGLRSQSSIRSSLVDGVGEDARYVVDRIAARRSITIL